MIILGCFLCFLGNFYMGLDFLYFLRISLIDMNFDFGRLKILLVFLGLMVFVVGKD